MAFPDFDIRGNLPRGVLKSTLSEVLDSFGRKNSTRRAVGERLARVYNLAKGTGHLSRFVVFGSFVTSKAEPNDVDLFLIMGNDFRLAEVEGEAALVFDHQTAQSYFGASVFWIRSIVALGGETSAIEDWMITREGRDRGIVEIIEA